MLGVWAYHSAGCSPGCGPCLPFSCGGQQGCVWGLWKQLWPFTDQRRPSRGHVSSVPHLGAAAAEPSLSRFPPPQSRLWTGLCGDSEGRRSVPGAPADAGKERLLPEPPVEAEAFPPCQGDGPEPWPRGPRSHGIEHPYPCPARAGALPWPSTSKGVPGRAA